MEWKTKLAVAVAVISWASAWVSIRVAVVHYTPGQLALGRYLVAMLVLGPVLLYRRPQIRRADWPRIALAGVCGFTLYNLCINQGELTITAGAAALIASTIPIFSTIGARLFLSERVNPATVQGGAVALSGVALIAFGEAGGVKLAPGAILVLLAALAAAAYSTIQKPLLARYAALDVTPLAIAASVVTMLPFGGGLPHALATAPLVATLNLLLLGVFPGAMGYVLWTYAMGRLAMARLMIFLYLVAPISVVLGFVLLGELPSLLSLAGGGVTLLGVVLANRKIAPLPATA